MTNYYKPVAMPVSYPELSRLCNGRLPATFEAWRLAENITRRGLVAEGHHVIGLPIVPEDLYRFCREHRCRADSAAMAALVARRGGEIYGTDEDYEAYRASLVVTEDVRAERGADVVEEGLGRVRRRPWWAFWRPKYEVEEVSAAQLEREAAMERRKWWALRHREPPATPAE
jgi:hypothetical protein